MILARAGQLVAGFDEPPVRDGALAVSTRVAECTTAAYGLSERGLEQCDGDQPQERRPLLESPLPGADYRPLSYLT